MVYYLQKLLLMAAAASLTLAAHPVEDVAKGCGVTPEVFDQLLNSSSVADFDIGQVAGLLGEPVEVINSWSEDSREFLFNELSRGAKDSLALIDPEQEIGKRQFADDDKLDKRQSPNAQIYRDQESVFVRVHNARMRSANTSCFANVPCGTCGAAASLVGVAGIATCTVIGVEAEAVVIGTTAGSATPAVWVAYVGCVAKVSAEVATLVGACHAAL
ncbi:hypothetical protein B0T11DRAFT_300304 [Plectosphaerella cucumerina]|uniref:Uncharacterized protein n=1 Tax=Plectosphaerella cucumerina TaxID=40658 RepID=A0A8K0X2M2_9PEZI|nr:hypothetical protein B0T11DRAFT_300304 [Plectosphaerella cucumerina]